MPCPEVVGEERRHVGDVGVVHVLVVQRVEILERRAREIQRQRIELGVVDGRVGDDDRSARGHRVVRTRTGQDKAAVDGEIIRHDVGRIVVFIHRHEGRLENHQPVGVERPVGVVGDLHILVAVIGHPLGGLGSGIENLLDDEIVGFHRATVVSTVSVFDAADTATPSREASISRSAVLPSTV